MARFPDSGNLVLTWSASTTALLTVVGLARRPGGSIEPFRATRTHAGDRTSETVTLVEDVASEVLSVTASIAAGVKRGQAYVRLGLVYGGVTHALAAGYVYDGFDVTLGMFVEPRAVAIYNESVTITNQATAGASDIYAIYVAASDTTLELLNGRTLNGDTVARNLISFLYDGTNVLSYVRRYVAHAAGAHGSIPVVGGVTIIDNDEPGMGRFVLAGTVQLRMGVEAVADGQDATFVVSFRVRGMLPAAPTRTTVGAGTEAVVVNGSSLDFTTEE